MFQKYIPRIILFILGVLIVLGTVTAIAASNTVSASHLDEQNAVITANHLKPAECASLNLVNIEVCTGGNCNGTNQNDLILGSAGHDNIKAKNGDDCIVAGGGDDEISGDNGSDICVGGSGNNTFDKCETIIDP